MRYTPATRTSDVDTKRRSSAVRPKYKRLQDRIDATYAGKLDGHIDTAFFEKMSIQWREERSRCIREIELHQNADKSFMDEGVKLLDLARNAQV